MRVSLLPLLLAMACDSPPPPAPVAPEPVATRIAPARIASVEASSELTDTTGTYLARAAVDADRGTAWCEGVEGLGAGETWTITLRETIDIDRIEIDGGFFKDDRTLTNNGRPRSATLASDAGWTQVVTFPFVPLREHRAKELHDKPRVVAAPGRARTLTLTLGEADAGRFTEDVCISEIAIFER